MSNDSKLWCTWLTQEVRYSEEVCRWYSIQVSVVLVHLGWGVYIHTHVCTHMHTHPHPHPPQHTPHACTPTPTPHTGVGHPLSLYHGHVCWVEDIASQHGVECFKELGVGTNTLQEQGPLQGLLDSEGGGGWWEVGDQEEERRAEMR